MYKLTITEDYFTDNKERALEQAIIDIENELNKLKRLKDIDEKAQESWKEISK